MESFFNTEWAKGIRKEGVVAVSVGRTKLVETREDKNGNMSPREISVIFEEGSPELWILGEQRYNTDNRLDGFSKPCASCHLSNQHGAPSHITGDISKFADEVIASYITTGRAQTISSVLHSWQFAKGRVNWHHSLSLGSEHCYHEVNTAVAGAP